MHSMTGFGKAELTTKTGYFLVEISGVNNRYLECSVRLPRQYTSLENRVREAVNEQIERGKVNVFIAHDRGNQGSSALHINVETLKDYHRQLKAAAKELKIKDEIELEDLLSLPEVMISARDSYDEDAIWAEMKKPLTKAIEAFVKMRENEGKAMAKDMLNRTTLISKLVQSVEKDSKGAVLLYREKLRKRIDDLIGSQTIDPLRLETEITMFAERTDISEECTRMYSHVSQFQKALKGTESAGKRLNFILQEMNRETNTMSAKSTEFKISTAVISIKEEIEKLREMVQNVE